MTFLEELMLFKVIFEDEQILVVDKPAGLVVNRSETNRQETLQDQLVDYFKLGHDLGIGDRAGIVHRLDRETSGVLVVAKTQKAFDFLQKQFKDRKIKKEYVALVHGFVKEKTGSVVGDIGRIGRFGKFGVVDEGRESRTDYEVQEYYQPRLFLHAQKIEFENLKHRQVVFEAQLPYDLIKAQANLNLLPDV